MSQYFFYVLAPVNRKKKSVAGKLVVCDLFQLNISLFMFSAKLFILFMFSLFYHSQKLLIFQNVK